MNAYGVSVETCDEALTAIARPHVASVQIILNAFRRKPLEQVLPAAAAAGVGIIARVPLASGLLPASTTSRPRSPRTTTARTTAPARPSTSARPSRACRSRWGCALPARSPP
jgi:aryl-alcohol dehydrogenase-like predicted oxidoreductase